MSALMSCMLELANRLIRPNCHADRCHANIEFCTMIFFAEYQAAKRSSMPPMKKTRKLHVLFNYKGQFVDDLKSGRSAIVTLKDGTTRKASRSNSPVGNWSNHELTKAAGQDDTGTSGEQQTGQKRAHSPPA